MDGKNSLNLKKTALRFVLIIGVVQLFADMTYEGARGIVGPFLGSLGASATVVGFTAGFGELMGYGFRSVTGYFADRTHKYWTFIFAGYFINMLAVPALALAGNWPLAAALVVAERMGRAIRKPSTDAMLCIAMVFIARTFYPRPHELEERRPTVLEAKGFSKRYWFYAVAGMLIAAGFSDFALVAFHFQKHNIVPQSWVPVFYSMAMVTAAIAALIFGRLLDKFGLPVILMAFALGAAFAPCVFLGGFPLALTGMILWGVGMGAQDSLLKAILSKVIPREKRSTGFGVFDTAFGISWFAGSAAMGMLYDKSIIAVVIFSVVLQLAALPVFVLAQRAK
jgi:hypothetical protein